MQLGFFMEQEEINSTKILFKYLLPVLLIRAGIAQKSISLMLVK